MGWFWSERVCLLSGAFGYQHRCCLDNSLVTPPQTVSLKDRHPSARSKARVQVKSNRQATAQRLRRYHRLSRKSHPTIPATYHLLRLNITSVCGTRIRAGRTLLYRLSLPTPVSWSLHSLDTIRERSGREEQMSILPIGTRRAMRRYRKVRSALCQYYCAIHAACADRCDLQDIIAATPSYRASQ